MDRKLLFRHSAMTVIPNEINPISKWFAMSGFSVLVENCFVCSLVREWREDRVRKGCLVISDLYVYLNIELVIGLVQ